MMKRPNYLMWCDYYIHRFFFMMYFVILFICYKENHIIIDIGVSLFLFIVKHFYSHVYSKWNSFGIAICCFQGRKFSVQGLLGKEMCSSAFVDGTLVIFRLAPQVFVVFFHWDFNFVFIWLQIFIGTFIYCRIITVSICQYRELLSNLLISLEACLLYVK